MSLDRLARGRPGRWYIKREIDNARKGFDNRAPMSSRAPGSSVSSEAVRRSGHRLSWRRGVLGGLIAAACLSSPWAPLTQAASQAPSAPPSADTNEEWLVDAQGSEYKIQRIDKTTPHLRLPGNRLRIVYGITLDLAGEDEHAFLVKVYRDTGGTGPAGPKAPTPDEKAKVAATYAFELPSSQTLGFAPFDEGLPRSGQWRNGFVLADMNGDGHPDIVHGPPRRRPGPPVIFLGDGAGRWSRWNATFPAQRYDYGTVAVADFNRDGRLDIVMGMHLLGITVLLGDGTGRFTSAAVGMDLLDPQTAFSSHALAAVDWDGDGHTDVVALAEGPRLGGRRVTPGALAVSSVMGLALYRNRGDATWEKKIGPNTRAMAGDALVLGESKPQGRPWLVAGTITRGQTDLVVRPGDPFTVESLTGLRRLAAVKSLAMADFDRDGHEDVAVAYSAHEGGQWRSGIDLFLTRPDGPPQRRTIYVEQGPRGVTALGAGDLDGDGRPDLVALSGNGETLVLRNVGGGAFAREDVQLTERVVGCQGYHVQVRDLDRDGRADIVAAFAAEPEGLGVYRTEGCPGQGSLRAWRSRPRS